MSGHFFLLRIVPVTNWAISLAPSPRRAAQPTELSPHVTIRSTSAGGGMSKDHRGFVAISLAARILLQYLSGLDNRLSWLPSSPQDADSV